MESTGGGWDEHLARLLLRRWTLDDLGENFVLRAEGLLATVGER